jgi:hypothetical protein
VLYLRNNATLKGGARAVSLTAAKSREHLPLITHELRIIRALGGQVFLKKFFSNGITRPSVKA